MEIIQEFGKIAGIAGLAVGVFLFLFKELIAKNIFPNLTREQGYKIIRTFMFLVWSIAILGIGTWAVLEYAHSKNPIDPVETEAASNAKTKEIKAEKAEGNLPEQPRQEKSNTIVPNKSDGSQQKPDDNSNVKTTINNNGTIGNVITGKEIKVEVKEQKIETPKEKNK